MNTLAASIYLRKKANESINRADDITVKIILAMLSVQEKESIEELSEFEKEIESRFQEYEQGE